MRGLILYTLLPKWHFFAQNYITDYKNSHWYDAKEKWTGCSNLLTWVPNEKQEFQRHRLCGPGLKKKKVSEIAAVKMHTKCNKNNAFLIVYVSKHL